MELKKAELKLKKHHGDVAVEEAIAESECSEQNPTGNSVQFNSSSKSSFSRTASWVPQSRQIRSCGRVFLGASVTAAAILFLLHALVCAYCSVDHLKPDFIVADLVWRLALWVAVAFVFALIDHGGRFRKESQIHQWIRRWAVLQAVRQWASTGWTRCCLIQSLLDSWRMRISRIEGFK